MPLTNNYLLMAAVAAVVLLAVATVLLLILVLRRAPDPSDALRQLGRDQTDAGQRLERAISDEEAPWTWRSARVMTWAPSATTRPSPSRSSASPGSTGPVRPTWEHG